MDYTHLQVTMDYSSCPIWVSNSPIGEEAIFINASIEEFYNFLPQELLHSFEIYRSLWEKANWSRHMCPTDHKRFPCDDLVYSLIDQMQDKLIIELRRYFPKCQVS